MLIKAYREVNVGRVTGQGAHSVPFLSHNSQLVWSGKTQQGYLLQEKSLDAFWTSCKFESAAEKRYDGEAERKGTFKQVHVLES